MTNTGTACKVHIARRLRQETTMTPAWIAQRLQMGEWTHVSNMLGAARGTGANRVDKP